MSRWGDSNEYTQHTISQWNKKISPNLIFWSCCKNFVGLKNEFELTMVNEPSVFEPLRIDCIWNANDYSNGLLQILGVMRYTVRCQVVRKFRISMVITTVDTYHVSMWCQWNVIGQLSRKKLLQELFWDTSVVNNLYCDLERKHTK